MTVEILIGDVREELAKLPADHFDCIVTSPPYWGLRDYGVAGQIGLEPTLGEHLAVMVDVMRAVRRVLKPTGTLWINYGDCYATAPNGRSAADTKAAGNDDRTFRDKPFSTVGPVYGGPPSAKSTLRGNGHVGGGPKLKTLAPVRRAARSQNKGGGVLKPKDLCMVPNRLAIALQDEGWWVRSEIVWGKSNPMPESITDRPATAHEKIWLLSKSARYFYAATEVRQGRTQDEDANGFRGGSYVNGEPGRRTARGNKQAMTAASAAGAGGSSGRRMAGFNERWDEKERGLTPRHEGHINHTRLDETGRGKGRNLRNYEPAPLEVWPMATRPFKEAHFATFPPELAERCLRAGCPSSGRVLDPFGGAGTVGLVADRLGLDCTLIELNPASAEIATRRIAEDAGMFSPLMESVSRSGDPEFPSLVAVV